MSLNNLQCGAIRRNVLKFSSFINCLRFANPTEATGGLEAGGSVPQVPTEGFGRVLRALGRVLGIPCFFNIGLSV